MKVEPPATVITVTRDKFVNVERRIEVPVVREIEHKITVTETRQRTVPIEKVVEKIVRVPETYRVEVPVEKTVERKVVIPKHKTVEVPVDRVVERLITSTITTTKEVPVERTVHVVETVQVEANTYMQHHLPFLFCILCQFQQEKIRWCKATFAPILKQTIK